MDVHFDLEALGAMPQNRALAVLQELQVDGFQIVVSSDLPRKEVGDELVRLRHIQCVDLVEEGVPDGAIHVGSGGIDPSDPFTLVERIISEAFR